MVCRCKKKISEEAVRVVKENETEFVPKIGKILISHGLMKYRIGALADNFGGAIGYQHGLTMMAKFMLGIMKKLSEKNIIYKILI